MKTQAAAVWGSILRSLEGPSKATTPTSAIKNKVSARYTRLAAVSERFSAINKAPSTLVPMYLLILT